jgi:excisionase family DNA binding protein
MKVILENTPLLFSMEEAAALLKISSKTLWKLCEAGKAPCVRFGARRLIPYSWLVSQGVNLPQNDDAGLVDTREASRLLGISPRHLFRFTQSGEIPCRRLGERNVRYSITELSQWVDAQSKFDQSEISSVK